MSAQLLFGVLSRFELDGRWGCRGDSEGDGVRDGEGDEWRRRYLKEDGDIEINNAPCVIIQDPT